MVLLLLSVPCLGASDPDVSRGLSLFRALEYDRAVVVLGRALVREDLTRDDRLEGLEALAFSYTILQDGVHAEETFHRLLDLQPSYEVPASQSPRLRESFAEARTTWLAGRKITVTVIPDPSDVRAQLGGDPGRVGQVVARTEAGEATRLDCKAGRCTGPKPDATFTVEVRDHVGTVLATAGPFEPRDDPGGPLPWWGWAIAGAGVVGGAAIVLLLASPSDAPPGDLGTLRLP